MQEQPYINYQTTPLSRLPTRRLLTAIIVILMLIIAIEAASGFSIRSKTGLLEVTAPTGTNISISALNETATNIGAGVTKLRVSPGTYLVMGIKDGARGAIAATVTKGQTTQVTIQPTTATGPRSVQSINFSGQAGLINAGLSVSQVNEIEQDIFQYKSSANKVTIAQGSIYPAPHNPNTDIGFSLDFNVSIDGTTYKAVATYTDTQDTSLQLTSATTGEPVFNSSSVQQTGGD